MEHPEEPKLVIRWAYGWIVALRNIFLAVGHDFHFLYLYVLGDTLLCFILFWASRVLCREGLWFMICTSEHFLDGAWWDTCSPCFRVVWLAAGVVLCFKAQKKQTQAPHSLFTLSLDCRSPSGFVLSWFLNLTCVLGALFLSDGCLGRMKSSYQDSEATVCLTFLKISEAWRPREERVVA